MQFDRQFHGGRSPFFTPGRIEGMFRAIAAKKVDDVKAFASSYGTRIIGPAIHPGLNNIFTPRPPAEVVDFIHKASLAKSGRCAMLVHVHANRETVR
jgi:hypothetical protein